MRVAVHQPNYLPWCGYFAKIAAADCFIVLDDVPMPTGRSYLSRASILGSAGSQWLTVPIARRGSTRIADVAMAQDRWPARHIRTLRACYGHRAYGDRILSLLAQQYADPGERLADFNLRLLQTLLVLLGITTQVIRASVLSVPGHGSAHLLGLVQAVGGSEYLSGPSGRSYLDESLFTQFGIPIRYGCYESIEYAQHSPRFVPALSVVDALCHVGPDAARALLLYRFS